MQDGATLVLDVGKTNSKLTLWDTSGGLLDTRARANAPATPSILDVAGVGAWLMESLSELARTTRIARIVPVAHGAAAALIRDGNIAAAPTCYERTIPKTLADEYDTLRDPYIATGSPRLPFGLNLGAQLYAAKETRVLPRDTQLLLLPQYWAWCLSGVAASEATSLGCHTDLWRPFDNRFSSLARAEGWSEMLAPLRSASAVLGVVTPDIARLTGLPSDCEVLCGLHDSNSAFFGARAHPELTNRDVTVISTGTWFVAMRAPRDPAAFQLNAAHEARDVLINVDVEGRPAPSARFMGGREVERLIGDEDSPLRTRNYVRTEAPKYIPEVLASGAFILPSFAPGVGPFPHADGMWHGPVLEGGARRAAAGLYLGLVAHESLSLIGACDAILIEGRFADDLTFAGMLASLRPDCDIYAAGSEDGLAFGALRLADPSLQSRGKLTKVAPLACDVTRYAKEWRERVAASVQ